MKSGGAATRLLGSAASAGLLPIKALFRKSQHPVPPLPPAKTISRAKGERLVKELCGRFADEVPAAFEKYLQHLASRKSYRRPVKGFPIWAG